MNTAEIKLNLFRKIDSLKAAQLEQVYDKLLSLLNTTSAYNLSKEENQAIDEAIEISKHTEPYSHEQVMPEAKKKFPKIHFK